MGVNAPTKGDTWDRGKQIPSMSIIRRQSGYADVDLSWDESVVGLSVREFKQRLHDGEPRVIYDGDSTDSVVERRGGTACC